MSQSAGDATQDPISVGMYGIHGMPAGRLEGHAGPVRGRYGDMPNSTNLRGFALIVLYFQVPHVCSLSRTVCQSSNAVPLHLSHIHAKTGKSSKTYANLVNPGCVGVSSLLFVGRFPSTFYLTSGASEFEKI